MKDIHEQTYYELLDVEPSASQEDILKAYNKARSTYSANSPALYSLMNKEEAQELLKLIDEAYAVLSNQFKRNRYDQGEKASSPVAEPPAPVVEKKSPHVATITESAPAQVQQAPPDNSSQQPKGSFTDQELGLASTRFGKYKIDQAFEEEIKKIEVFTGPLLQKIRLYKNISLDQIAETSKVNRPYLIAIEENNFACLPATVFIRGFLVQIAKALQLDTNKVANSYLRTMQEAQKK
jgi:curved DNA-binding protein CbpA